MNSYIENDIRDKFKVVGQYKNGKRARGMVEQLIFGVVKCFHL